MNENDKKVWNDISDQQLEEIVGGIVTSRVPVIKKENSSFYSSGDTPKYSVGQRVGIECTYMNSTFKIPCIVLSVSEAATGGIFCKEFVYSVEITPPSSAEPLKILQGKVYDSVYESCLYEA